MFPFTEVLIKIEAVAVIPSEFFGARAEQTFGIDREDPDLRGRIGLRWCVCFHMSFVFVVYFLVFRFLHSLRSVEMTGSDFARSK